LYHREYTKFVALCLLPILLMILTTHTHANIQNNGSKIISPSNNSHFEVGNLDITTAGSNNSKLSDIELGISNIEPSVKLNQASKNSDIFSIYNFQLATQKNKANESKLDKSNNHQFNGIYTADNKSIQNNDFQISATPPSILEIESDQNSTNLFSTSNKTQLFAVAGKDRTVYEGTSVTLNGSNSTSKDSVILSYAWRQIPNPNITIGSANTAIWSFVAPNVSADTNLTFELTVTDNKGITSTDDVNIIVRDGNNVGNEINMSNVEGAEQNINSKLEPKPRNLVIQTLIDKNPVAKGEKQIIKIDLFDGNSDDKINNATIKGQIMDSSKKVIKKFSMNNNSVNVSLNIPKNAKVGNSVVSVNASAPGYISSNMDTNFRIQK
jgi:K319L-like, PKD domain